MLSEILNTLNFIESNTLYCIIINRLNIKYHKLNYFLNPLKVCSTRHFGLRWVGLVFWTGIKAQSHFSAVPYTLFLSVTLFYFGTELTTMEIIKEFKNPIQIYSYIILEKR